MKKIFSLVLLIANLAMAEEVYETVVLGGGIGGLTSALYLSRAGITPLVIEGDKPGGALAQSPKVQNWPGELEISGADLVSKIRAQVVANGAKFLPEQVIDIDLSERPFTITTSPSIGKDKVRKIKAQTAIVALGSNPRFLGVPGEKGENGYWSKGVYSCAVCDGSLYKDKVVAVVGGGDAAITEAHYLSDVAGKVVVIVRGKDFKTQEKVRKDMLLAKPNVEVIYQTTVKEIKGDGENVTHVMVQGQKQGEIPVDAVFLALGSIPNTDILKNQVELDKQGFIILKKYQETSVNGVYAAGDIADPIFQQAVSAAGDGARAALQAKAYLSSLPASEKIPTRETTSEEQLSAPAQIIEIQNTSHFNKEIKNGSLPIIVDFYATWCGPCKHFSPIFDELSRTFAGKIRFFKVNVDNNEELSNLYKIKGIPTLIVLDKNGNLISKKTGAYEINDLTKKLGNLEQKSSAQIEANLKQNK